MVFHIECILFSFLYSCAIIVKKFLTLSEKGKNTIQYCINKLY